MRTLLAAAFVGLVGGSIFANLARIRETVSTTNISLDFIQLPFLEKFTLTPKLGNLTPEVRRRALNVVDQANEDQTIKEAALRVGIFDGWRSVSDQQKLIDSRDSFVSDPLNSYHPWGLAVDFVFLNRLGQWTFLDELTRTEFAGNARNNPIWQALGSVIKQNGFEWGGDFITVFDGPHGQFTQTGRIAQLRGQFGTPDNFLIRQGVMVA